MLVKPRKELNEQSPQSIAGLQVQLLPQVLVRVEKDLRCRRATDMY